MRNCLILPPCDFMVKLPAYLLLSLGMLTGPAFGVEALNYIVAIVDDDIIVRTELDKAIRNIRSQLKGEKLPTEAVIERQVLDRLIVQRVQLELASQSNVKVDDETLTSAIRSIAERNHISLSDFRTSLEQDGYKFENFREDVRNELIIGRLQQREVANHITVTDQEVDDFLANQSVDKQSSEEGEWNLAHILISIPEGSDPKQIEAAKKKAEAVLAKLHSGADFHTTAMQESSGRNALEGGELGWRRFGQIPSLFASVIPSMKPGEVAGPLQGPAGFHLLKLLDYRSQSSHTVGQTRVQQILIRTGDNTTDEDARERLLQLRGRIQGGESFGELARTHSEDSTTAHRQGMLGWVNPGDLAPEFEQTMNRLSSGELSPPFKTPFGWHLIQVLERRQQNNQKENLRAKALETIRTRKTEEELEAWLRRLREEAYVEIRLDDG